MTERPAKCPQGDQHDFVEVYYGHVCKGCGLFYAFGCAPWDEEEEEMYEQGYF